MTTEHPCAASFNATALPTPLLDPVIIATLPCTSMDLILARHFFMTMLKMQA